LGVRRHKAGQELLEDIRHRGLIVVPKLAIGDDVLGLWNAISKVYPEMKTKPQQLPIV